MRIHFDAASLFPVMVILTSIAVTQKVYALDDNMESRLNGCYVEMVKFSFEKNGKCTTLDKTRTKKS